MNDSIYTIPISEVFEQPCGCPLCRMEQMLEQRCIDDILGAAMMEPDIRIETNKLGFCKTHFAQMMTRRNRLSLALMLESHLDTLLQSTFDKAPAKSHKAAKTLQDTVQSCYVCQKIAWAMERMLKNLFTCYRTQEAFRALFADCEYICLPHYARLLELCATYLPKKMQAEFVQTLTALCKGHLVQLKADVSAFCKSYNDTATNTTVQDPQAVKTAVARAICALTKGVHEA